jgi:DNA-binding transcriptional ArsR family regulator
MADNAFSLKDTMSENQKDTKVSNPDSTAINNKLYDVFLSDDPHILFIIKKTEKIIAALYLITDGMDDREPLRLTLRDKGLSFLNDVYRTKLSVTPSAKSMYGQGLDLLSLINLGVFGGLISDMNASIVHTQLNLVLEAINKRESGGTASSALQETFFDIGKFPDKKPETLAQPVFAAPTPFSDEISHIYKGQSNVLYTNNKDKSFTLGAPKPLKDKLYVKGDRREKILGLLKRKDKLTVRDFTQIIKDCSEKTIQRELLDLVHKGILKKEGERRWSRYSLT